VPPTGTEAKDVVRVVGPTVGEPVIVTPSGPPPPPGTGVGLEVGMGVGVAPGQLGAGAECQTSLGLDLYHQSSLEFS
jgi:hypothetical protein